MRTIYEANESWVKVRGIEEGLFQRVLHADVCLSDLDDTDAASPAKFIALHDLKSRLWNNFDYLCWFAETGWHYLFNGNNVESQGWKKYVNTFLKDERVWKPEALAHIDQLIDAQHITASIFPGVPEFYSLLKAQKYYVSRNLALIVEKYGQKLEFKNSYGEVEKKGNFVEHFVEEHPSFQYYVVRGNSDEDKEMLDVLQSSIRRRKIKSVCGIFVAGNGKNPGFEIETSLDQTGLVELLKSHQSQ